MSGSVADNHHDPATWGHVVHHQSFGIAHRDDALALIVCVLTLQMTSPFLGVLGDWLSRRHEVDDFARPMARAEPTIAALVRLALDNASALTPDPLHALVNFDHPPAPRVRRLREASGARQGASA